MRKTNNRKNQYKISLHKYAYGGFEQIKAAVFFMRY